MKKLSSGVAIGVAVSIAGMSLLMPFIAAAQVPGVVEPPPSTRITDVNSVIGVLGTVVNVLFTILMVIAVIYIFYAAFLYLTAKGETENITKANSQLLYSAVAIAVALIAIGVRSVVESILQ